MRYDVDRGARALAGGRVLLGGSPLRLYRLTDAGAQLWARIAAGTDVEPAPAEARLVARWVAAGVLHPRSGPLDAGAGPITVVVPVRDRPAELDRLLGSLRRHGPAGPVVVVDDGSVDPAATAAVVARHGARALRLEVSVGPGGARNAGVAAATTELVALVDSDCEVTAGWWQPLVGHLSVPGVVAAAPRIRARPSPPAAPGRGAAALAAYDRVRSPLDLGDGPARVAPGTRVSYVPGAALVVRRDAFDAAGGFDPALRVGEDVDLVWRWVSAGHAVRYEPAAEVVHDVRADPAAWLAQRFRYGTSAAGLDARHPGALAPVSCSPWSAVVWALVGSGHPVAGAALAVGSAAALPRRLPDVPTHEALRLALVGHLGAGRLLARAVVRVWWPLLVAAAPWSRQARSVLGRSLLAVVLDGVLAARRQGGADPGLPLPALAALVVADDAAYGAGVWWGCVRRGRVGPLLPRFTGWPGRDRSGAAQSTGASEANARARSSMAVRSSGSAAPTST